MKQVYERLLIQEAKQDDPSAVKGWEYISWNMFLSEDFIYRAREYVDWQAVLMRQPVSTQFLKENKSKIRFPSIFSDKGFDRPINKDSGFWDEFGELFLTESELGLMRRVEKHNEEMFCAIIKKMLTKMLFL